MSNFKMWPSLADLDSVFELRQANDPSANPTKLYYPLGLDLCLRYKMWSGGAKSALTKYNVIKTDGTFQDLNQIFEPVTPTFPTTQSSIPPLFGNYVCVDLDGSNMVMCAQGGVPTGDPHSYLYWSNNSGQTLNISKINGASDVKFFGCVAISGSKAVAMGRLTQTGTTNTFYLSSDYGQTYVSATGGATGVGAASTPYITMSGAIALWTAFNQSTYRSTDYGNTWTNIGFYGRGAPIKIYGTDAYICRGGDSFWYSTNSGLTFTRTTTATVPIRSVTKSGANLYVFGDNVIYKSIDNGITLTAIYSSALIRGIGCITSCLRSNDSNGDFVWFGNFDTNLNYYSNDGGINWTATSGAARPYTCIATPTRIVVGSYNNGGFYYGKNTYIT